MRVLIFALLVAACAASCPNDCNGQGVCNIYSACQCYRNWMGADCSQRVCFFGNAFIDTPQGDLNADGRVDRPDVYGVEIISATKLKLLDAAGVATATDLTTLADAAQSQIDYAKTLTFAAGQYLSTSSTSADELNAKGVVDVAATGRLIQHTDNSVRIAFTLPVTTTTGKAPTFASDEDVYEKDIATSFEGQMYAKTSMKVSAASTAASTDFKFTGTNTADIYVYETQFSNEGTWERYPLNHGAAISANTLKAFWDEAHFYAECSGKGLCDRSSGSCDCFVGYEGEGCTRTSCPGACSGHGVCTLLSLGNSAYKLWDAEKTQYCVCDPGYKGIDCAQRTCPKGDDPITRPAKESTSVDAFKTAHPGYTTELNAIDHLLPNPAGQVTEIQVFGHAYELHTTQTTTGVFDKTNSFALEFTDEFGDKWVTKTLDWRTASAKDVETVLEGLPNSAIQDVQVSVKFLTASQSDYGVTGDCSSFEGESVETNPCVSTSNGCCGKPRVWSVTFLTNTGDVEPLGVRYKMNTQRTNCGTADVSCDVDASTTHEATPTATIEDLCPAACGTPTTEYDSDLVDSEGKFHTLGACDANKATVPCLAQVNWECTGTADDSNTCDLDARTTASGETNFYGKCPTGCDKSNMLSTDVQAGGDVNDMIAVLGSNLLVELKDGSYAYKQSCTGGSSCAVDATVTPNTCASGCSWSSPSNRFFLHTDGTHATASDRTRHPAFITEARKGSQENVECSNRGLCDYDSGLCKCFNGFTDDDCSVQNALAMY